MRLVKSYCRISPITYSSSWGWAKKKFLSSMQKRSFVGANVWSTSRKVGIRMCFWRDGTALSARNFSALPMYAAARFHVRWWSSRGGGHESRPPCHPCSTEHPAQSRLRDVAQRREKPPSYFPDSGRKHRGERRSVVSRELPPSVRSCTSGPITYICIAPLATTRREGRNGIYVHEQSTITSKMNRTSIRVLLLFRLQLI